MSIIILYSKVFWAGHYKTCSMHAGRRWFPPPSTSPPNLLITRIKVPLAATQRRITPNLLITRITPNLFITSTSNLVITRFAPPPVGSDAKKIKRPRGLPFATRAGPFYTSPTVKMKKTHSRFKGEGS